MQYDFETILNEMVDKFKYLITDYPEISLYAITKAVIKQESDFNASCVTYEKNIDDYSIGLMQVTIGTARGIVSLSDKSNAEVKTMLLDGRYNIYVGIQDLINQIIRYAGNLRFAASAYNAGSVMFRVDGNIIYWDNKGFFKVVNNKRVDIYNYDEDLLDTYEIGNFFYVNNVITYYNNYLSGLGTEKKTTFLCQK